MPAFPTPQPIHVTLDLAAGDAHLSATERDDTVVDVAPRDASRRADVRAAEQTRVDFSDGRLHVRTPRQTLSWGKGGFVEVTIALPAGSRVDGRTGMGELRAEGTLADFTFKSGAGAIRLERGGRVQLTSGVGDITVEGAAGDAKVATGAGVVRLGTLERNAHVNNGNGAIAVGDAGGDLRVTASNGDITVDRAAGNRWSRRRTATSASARSRAARSCSHGVRRHRGRHRRRHRGAPGRADELRQRPPGARGRAGAARHRADRRRARPHLLRRHRDRPCLSTRR